jgi:signal transduction histidine kinase
MKSLERASLSALLVGGVTIFLAAGFLWLHLATPFDGARIPSGTQVWQPGGIVVMPLREQANGLHPGDLVVAVDGRSMEEWSQMLFQFDAKRPSWQVGQTVTYTIRRNGQLIELPVTFTRYPLHLVLAREWWAWLFGLLNLLVAAFVFIKRPNEPAARVLLVGAAAVLSVTTWLGLHITDIIGGIGVWLFLATTVGVYLLSLASVLHFVLLFPRPEPLIRRHRWLIPLLYASGYVLFTVLCSIAWVQAQSTLEWLGRLDNAFRPVGGGYLLLLLVGSTRAYRRAREPVSRSQMRWITLALVLICSVSIGLGVLPELLWGEALVSWNMIALIGLAMPLAMAIAIVRHQLFDIDRLLSRALVYGSLTSCIVGIYVVIVGYLGAVFNARGNLGISLIATGVVAVLFQPLRERLQRTVNRLMYGERDEPYAVISRLGQRLEATIAPDAVLYTIVETVRESLKLPYVAIALVQEGKGEIVAESGDMVTTWHRNKVTASGDALLSPMPPPHLVTVPLTYQSESVGQLLLAPRDLDEAFSAADQRLLDDLARQAGIAVHAVRLTYDLQRSRERLVAAREEERRRLRRDLHDGLGPQLASLTLTIAAARELLRHDADAADRLLQELTVHTQAAIADIRRVVYDLRPPALDDLGLVLALREQAASYRQAGLRITIDAPDRLPPLPAAVEAAAYRIVQEALTNVVRHARARTCVVRLTLGDVLEVQIRDDGVGLGEGGRSGVGLMSMRERTAELGGSCQIESLPGRGTCIHARLPLHQEGA